MQIRKRENETLVRPLVGSSESGATSRRWTWRCNVYRTLYVSSFYPTKAWNAFPTERYRWDEQSIGAAINGLAGAKTRRVPSNAFLLLPFDSLTATHVEQYDLRPRTSLELRKTFNTHRSCASLLIIRAQCTPLPSTLVPRYKIDW